MNMNELELEQLRKNIRLEERIADLETILSDVLHARRRLERVNEKLKARLRKQCKDKT